MLGYERKYGYLSPNICSDRFVRVAKTSRYSTWKLRRVALQARRELRAATMWEEWQRNGWKLQPWQTQKVILVQTGELGEGVKLANKKYRLGTGASTSVTKERAISLGLYRHRKMPTYLAG